ncbi:MAG TPA: hypothetical protein PKH19_02855, partial [Candidatus Syntrophosphaera sp.]|nr:hypothetical protein [Candidatus Syntrophosphaera sp.]
MKRVALGLSGGVDSAVSAMLLLEQGFEVTGATMSFWDGRPVEPDWPHHGCFGPHEADNIAGADAVVGSSQRFGATFMFFSTTIAIMASGLC